MELKYYGLVETIENLTRIENELNGGPTLVRAMQDSTLYVTGDARRNAPVDTNALRASIMPDVRSKMNSIEGVVGSNKAYAPFQELGARPHWPPIAALEGWARRHGTSAYLVARAIARRGLRAVRYLQRALDDNVNKIVQRFERAVREIIR